ncbi:MAG TPA: ribonuclease P protein component [Chromatiales bacterium]|nr:ribonuclease P protein component [Chromatiales bacterium]
MPEPVSKRFSRQQRLPNPAAFKYVFDKPCKVSSRNFTILARANQRNQARLGLAVPKRQIRRAVARNRIKRLVRESFREHQADLAGLDIVVLARAGAGREKNRDILASLAEQWDRLRQTCEKS